MTAKPLKGETKRDCRLWNQNGPEARGRHVGSDGKRAWRTMIRKLVLGAGTHLNGGAGREGQKEARERKSKTKTDEEEGISDAERGTITNRSGGGS